MKLKFNEKTHGYWLDGKRCKGVSTVAKIPDDTYRLEAWTARQVAIGMAMSPELVESVAAHFDDYQKVTAAVEDAKKAAGAHEGSTRGVSLHRITERVDLNEVIISTPLSAYVVASWQAALEAADLEVLPDFVERAVVYPDLFIAGRFDRIVRRKSDGRLFIGDVKGGTRAIEYPHSMACQLALYANAPLLCGPTGSGDWQTETFEPMPDVDKSVGYIFHLPDTGEAAVATVDIAGGWDIATRAIFPVLEWRDRRDLCQPVATIGGGEPAPVAPTAVEQAPPADPQRRQAVIDHIKRLPDVEREELARRWPVGVPTFKQFDAHTDTQLDAIEAMVEAVDWSPVAPEPQPDPEPDLPPAARWVAPDEGAMLDEATVEVVKRTVAELDKVLLAQVNDWALEGHAAHRPFSLSREDCRTQRRFEIMRASIALSPYEPDVVRAALGFVMGDEVQTSVSIGAALGSLTIAEASRLALLAELIGSTISVLVYASGRVDFDGPGLAAVAA